MYENSDEVVGGLARLAERGPYFTLGTGPLTGSHWQPTATLRDRPVRDRVVDEMALALGVDEVRVAASTLFFGFAARLWSIAAGIRQSDGRCVSLAPDELLWRADNGTLQLHIEVPRMGRSARTEVLDNQLDPCIESWRDIVAPGLLWGNTTSALLGAVGMTGQTGSRWVTSLLNDPRLQLTMDPKTRRRRSCCLFYRTPTGGVCGDCPFPSPPTTVDTEETS